MISNVKMIDETFRYSAVPPQLRCYGSIPIKVAHSQRIESNHEHATYALMVLHLLWKLNIAFLAYNLVALRLR